MKLSPRRIAIPFAIVAVYLGYLAFNRAAAPAEIRSLAEEKTLRFELHREKGIGSAILKTDDERVRNLLLALERARPVTISGGDPTFWDFQIQSPKYRVELFFDDGAVLVYPAEKGAATPVAKLGMGDAKSAIAEALDALRPSLER